LTGIYTRPQQPSARFKTGATVLIHADQHRFRQRHLTGSCASVSAFLLLEPL
jgi:hypothetical protein